MLELIFSSLISFGSFPDLGYPDFWNSFKWLIFGASKVGYFWNPPDQPVLFFAFGASFFGTSLSAFWPTKLIFWNSGSAGTFLVHLNQSVLVLLEPHELVFF